MFGNRVVGLSSKQSVPRLLSTLKKPAVAKEMKEVDVDAPPLSSSESSDDERPGHVDIQRSRFGNSPPRKSPPVRGTKDAELDREVPAPANRFKRTQGSTRPGSSRVKPDPRSRGTETQPESVDGDSWASSPAPKKPRRGSTDAGELGSQFRRDLFAPTKSFAPQRRYGSKDKTLGSTSTQKKSPARRTKRPSPKESTPEDPDKFKLKLPSSPPEAGEGVKSPARKFKAIPSIDFDTPAEISPVRKRRLRMPSDDGLLLSGNHENPEASQRPVFTIPDALPDSFIEEEYGQLNAALSPTADASTVYHFLRGSKSPLTDPEPPDLAPAATCPLCSKPVDREHLDSFQANHPHTTVANMRKFCDQHRQRSAKETWVEKGYPDIDWCRLDERMARHHGLIRRILGSGAPSHYGDLFRARVLSGRNRTLFQSDANLTPGYYGIRGLRAMTEYLITVFAPLLRERSVEDRLVSARGHTAYLQAVLVPELAVRLVMEDMDVGEEEARDILAESTEVGELLNDEIADVVVESSDEESGGSPR